MLEQDCKYLAINSTGVIYSVIKRNELYKSIDNGDNWEELNFSFASGEYETIESLFIDQYDNIFIGVNIDDGNCGNWRGKIYRSNDSGNNWTMVGSEM